MDPAPFTDGWHLEAMAEHLEAVSFGRIRNLLINVPPRHSKSLMVSVAWQVWTWIQKPNPKFPLVGPQVKFLCMSYSDQLSLDIATTARRLIASPWFQERWGKRVQIMEDKDAQNRFDTTAGGIRFSNSFGGTVTGRGADIQILDDPHKMGDEVESEKVRQSVIRTYDGVLKSRITDPRISATVMVAQRGHADDLSNHLIESDEFVHLCLPTEYEQVRHCKTDIGWEDPRTEDGELLWPERFGPDELAPYKTNPYEWASQWQQMPVPRGGAIFKSELWELWQSTDGNFPAFEFVLASLDSAYTEKEENDPSALTVWGVWRDETLDKINPPRKVMLVDAWRKRLPIHGPRIEPLPNENVVDFNHRTRPQWGLVEWVAHTCRLRKVDRLLIEGKASGISVAQELQRIYGDERWTVQIDNPKGDKVARAHAVVSAFTQGIIYAPDREWAQMTINEMADFPKGRYDDLTDSATQALKHLRSIGLIQHPEERINDMARMSQYKPRKMTQALYPV